MTGIICIDKPEGITSFGVCAKLRGITGQKKCGHTGTLDPMATGVLPVMLGGATKFLDYLPDSDKGYTARFILGKTTDTLDITGKVTGEFPVNCTQADVEKALANFRGRIMQTPPMYSAVSVDGKRLYELARSGVEVERKAREVEIKKLELVSCENGEYEIDVLCSKGTYIRSLIDDLGRVLGCGAVMTSLRRTLACGFTLSDAVGLDELQRRKDCGESFDDIVVSVEKAFESFGRVTVSDAQSVRFKNGGALDLTRLKQKLSLNVLYRVYSKSGEFLGLGECTQTELKVKRLYIK